MAIIIIVGMTIMRICFVVISCLLKRTFYYVHLVNISSL